VIHFRPTGFVPIAHVLPALCEHQALFDELTMRQDHPQSPHRATRSIYLRMPAEITVDTIFWGQDVVDYPAASIPAFYKLMADVAFATRQDNRVARVMLVELAAGAEIAPHIDQGAYAELTERWHCALRTNRLCTMHSGGEVVHMRPGEVWWFDKHVVHHVENLGAEPRVHLIMDTWR
jgi:quercetin dioxygenase-like cupin family protein